MAVASNARLTFNYYGGKKTDAAAIVALLPRDDRARHYVEVCGGSGAVLCAISPPYPLETWNDVDSRLVNFFRVLREQPEALQRACELTPYAREEYASTRAEEGDDLERARRFAFRTAAAWGALHDKTGIGLVRQPEFGNRRVDGWRSLVGRLPDLARRFARVQVEQRPAVDLIRHYDDPQAVFYVDPPYVAETRSAGADGYRHEMHAADHVALAGVLYRIEGRAVVSGYDSKLYRRLYHGWRVVELSRRHINISRGHGRTSGHLRRRELAWCNFDG